MEECLEVVPWMTKDGSLKLSGRWCIPKLLLWTRLSLDHRGAKDLLKTLELTSSTWTVARNKPILSAVLVLV